MVRDIRREHEPSLCATQKAVDEGTGASPQVTVKGDNSRREILRPGEASFVAAMLKMRSSILSFSVAQLDVRSPGLG